MKKYDTPLLWVNRLAAVSITTVSTEADWKEDEWDEALGDDTAVASDEA